MKKALLTTLTMIYMLISSGIAMEIHYCMGKRAGTEFFSKGDKKCGRCGMEEKEGCCSDEHRFIKLSDEHKIAVHNQVTDDFIFAQQQSYQPLEVGGIKGHSTFNKFHPPDPVPLYLQNRAILI